MARYKVKVKFWKLIRNLARIRILLEKILDLVDTVEGKVIPISNSNMQYKIKTIAGLFRELRENKVIEVKKNE